MDIEKKMKKSRLNVIILLCLIPLTIIGRFITFYLYLGEYKNSILSKWICWWYNLTYIIRYIFIEPRAVSRLIWIILGFALVAEIVLLIVNIIKLIILASKKPKNEKQENKISEIENKETQKQENEIPQNEDSQNEIQENEKQE